MSTENKMRLLYSMLVLLFIVLPCIGCGEITNNKISKEKGIQVYPENAFYWAYNGTPTLLLGGTREDNLFQIDDLEAHLNELKSAGGNYVRCTLSSRDEGNEKPYLLNSAGFYDLNQPNPAYWNKLRTLFELAQKREIIIQVEIWATYDFYWGEARWANNPFNPKLNINYDDESSGLPDSIAYPAQSKVNPFFESVPALANNTILLPYQKNFVDSVLELSLKFDNILYCIDNETNANFEWGKFWAAYLKERAVEHGKDIYITEMWDNWDPTNGAVAGAKLQHPDLGGWFAEYTNPDLHHNSNYAFSINDSLSYNFVDISNHNAQDGQTHFDTGYWVWQTIERSGRIRPINNVKIYGADISQIWSGSVEEGKQRFWRNIFAGHASSRFHRPGAGIGLSNLAQANIKSMREITDEVDLFSMVPSNGVIVKRSPNEAFCMGNEKHEYLIYFPAGGVIELNIPDAKYRVKSLLIDKTFWLEEKIIQYPGVLVAPHNEAWAFMIKKID